MVRQIVIELETPGDSRTMFRLRIDENLIADGLTAAQAHHVCEALLPKRSRPTRPRAAPGWRRRRRRSKAGVSTPFCGRSPDIASPPKSTSIEPERNRFLEPFKVGAS